jgi:copper chaperone CopZ
MTCSFAVRGALSKFPGVESVDVSLKKGLATVILKPGNTIRPEQFWEAIRKNGFTAKQTTAIVRGEVEGHTFKVWGTNQVFTLGADPKSPEVLEEVKRQAGRTIAIEGTLTPAKDLKSSVPLIVKGVASEGK